MREDKKKIRENDLIWREDDLMRTERSYDREVILSILAYQIRL